MFLIKRSFIIISVFLSLFLNLTFVSIVNGALDEEGKMACMELWNRNAIERTQTAFWEAEQRCIEENTIEEEPEESELNNDDSVATLDQNEITSPTEEGNSNTGSNGYQSAQDCQDDWYANNPDSVLPAAVSTECLAYNTATPETLAAVSSGTSDTGVVGVATLQEFCTVSKGTGEAFEACMAAGVVGNLGNTANIGSNSHQNALADIRVSCGENTGLAQYDGGICTDEFGNIPQTGFEALKDTMQRLLNWLVGIAYLLAVISLFWGGFVMLTAGGDASKAASAKAIIVSVLKGIFFITAAWILVDFTFGLFIDESQIDNYKYTENHS